MKGWTLPYVLAAKSSVTVQVCATPTARGSNLVTLTITGTSNDITSALTGTVDIMGLEACAQAAPAVAFQSALVPHNVTDSVEITVTNCGDIPTTYTPSITGAEASLYSIMPAVSPVVQPGNSTTFWVYFTPISSGLKPATVTFTGTSIAPQSVDLQGTGACAVLDPVAAVTAPPTAAGSTQTFDITVNNSGNLAWTPGAPMFNPAGAFTFVSASVSPIPAGGQSVLTFSFNPPSMNTFATVISFPDAAVCGNQLEISVSGVALPGSVGDVTSDGYILTQNTPNPAVSGTSSFNYTVPEHGKVRIILADVTGKMVRELVNTNVSQGTYTVEVTTSDLASGTYLYIMEAGNARLVKQMVVAK
jgi:hypothetical protein